MMRERVFIGVYSHKILQATSNATLFMGFHLGNINKNIGINVLLAVFNLIPLLDVYENVALVLDRAP